MDKSGTNLTMVAYEKLKNAIMRNEIKFGYCISGNKIARSLNMSRTPVREAIILLERDGLVEIQNGVGFFVRQPSINELREITEVRRILECAALRDSIDFLDVDDLKRCRDKWVRAQQGIDSVGQKEIEMVRRLDTETHDLLTHNCNNSFLIEILETIELRSTRIQYLSIDAQNIQGAITQHLDIIDALLLEKYDEAIELLGDNINFSVDYIVEHPSLLDSGNGSLMSSQYLDEVLGR